MHAWKSKRKEMELEINKRMFLELSLEMASWSGEQAAA